MVRLALCWFILPFVFFSTCSGKLGTYILPCYPPLALLIAVGILKCLSKGDIKGFMAGAWVALSAVALSLLTLIASLIVVPVYRCSAWLIALLLSKPVDNPAPSQ